MRDPRRLASLFVLVVAGLASLATSQIPHADDQVDGRTTLGPDGATLSVAVSISGVRSPSVDWAGDSEFRFQTRRDPGPGISDLAGPVEVQIVGPTDNPATAPWTATPATVPLPVDGCESGCVLDFGINLRARHADAVPIVVPWRIYAIAIGDVSGLTLAVDAGADAPLMTDIAIWSTVVGLALGLGAALTLAVVGKRLRSRLAMLEAIAALTLIGAGALVAQGLLVGLESGAAGLLALAAGFAVALGLALRRPFLSRPGYWLLPIALVAAPVMLARFVVGGEFRVSDVAAAFIAVGVVMAIAVVLAAPLARGTLACLTLSQPRTLLVLGIAAVGIGVAASWAVLISAGTTKFSVITSVPFEAIYVPLTIGLWRWLSGDSITPFTVGLVIPIGAIGALGAVMVSLIGTLFSTGPASPLVFESIAAIGLCGILFAVLTIRPPRRRDPNAPKGRAMQFRWDDDEVALSMGTPPPFAPVS